MSGRTLVASLALAALGASPLAAADWAALPRSERLGRRRQRQPAGFARPGGRALEGDGAARLLVADPVRRRALPHRLRGRRAAGALLEPRRRTRAVAARGAAPAHREARQAQRAGLAERRGRRRARRRVLRRLRPRRLRPRRPRAVAHAARARSTTCTAWAPRRSWPRAWCCSPATSRAARSWRRSTPTTGRERWRTPRPEALSGHATPVVLARPGGARPADRAGLLPARRLRLATGASVWFANGLPSEMKSGAVLGEDAVYVVGYSSPLNEPGQHPKLPPYAEWRRGAGRRTRTAG